MIKPKRLERGDKIAIVSLSWGGLGDETLIHKFYIAKKRLEVDFGLRVVCMPHALKGSEFVYKHPELRAKDLMDAFKDPSISGIFCAIGGDDTIRTMAYIDLNIIKKNPKIFMGYSDTTINHFMMYQAGLVSYYGPSIMCEFGEYVAMFDYTKKAIKDILFSDSKDYKMLASPVWTDDYVEWKPENMSLQKDLKEDPKGYEILQGTGIKQGHLLGGCLDVFMICIGTKIWPSLDDWQGAILFIETSEDKPSPEFMKWTLRNLAAQGILNVIKGILVAKPQGEVHYQAYKEVISQVVTKEEGLKDLAIFYNVNFGHGMPIGILPYGIKIELDCDQKMITFLESATKDEK
jgi:muramoyltetrapeptide carboxypeptidase LdcA involved in peptidoglycan recycling